MLRSTGNLSFCPVVQYAGCCITNYSFDVWETELSASATVLHGQWHATYIRAHRSQFGPGVL